MWHFIGKSPRPRRRGFRGISKLLCSRAVCASLVAILSLAVYARNFADINTFVISHEDGITVHETYTQDPRIVLMEAGIYIGENDFVSLPDGPITGTAAQIEIIRAKTVTVAMDGETHTVITLGGTVADALHKLNYQEEDHDVVEPDAGRRIEDGMHISVTRYTFETEIESIVLPYETRRTFTEDLEPGVERIAEQGSEGLQEIEYSRIYQDGELISRRLERDEVVLGPVDAHIEVGAPRPEPTPTPTPKPKLTNTFPGVNAAMPVASKGILTLPDGTELAYSHIMDAEATAYTAERQRNKLNASGKIARVGTIAVDPKVIPLGSKVYITSADGTWVYGTAICEDTGGVVKGNIIDLYFDKYDECINFGRRKATVYILTDNEG